MVSWATTPSHLILSRCVQNRKGKTEGKEFQAMGRLSSKTQRPSAAQQKRKLEFISNPTAHKYQKGLQCICGNLKNSITLKYITEARWQLCISWGDHLDLVSKKGVLVTFFISIIKLTEANEWQKDFCQPIVFKGVLCGRDGVARELAHLQI